MSVRMLDHAKSVHVMNHLPSECTDDHSPLYYVEGLYTPSDLRLVKYRELELPSLCRTVRALRYAVTKLWLYV